MIANRFPYSCVLENGEIFDIGLRKDLQKCIFGFEADNHPGDLIF